MGNEYTMREPIDLGGLVLGITGLRGCWSAGDVARLCMAVTYLRRLPLPGAYVDGLQDELFQMIGQTVPPEEKIKVYLAFYGCGERASFLKIGVAKNVKNRIASFSTGNPLINVWTFAADIGGRQRAMGVESALLKHLVADAAQGEWIKVQGLTESASLAFVDSLAEVATETRGQPVTFERVV